MNCNLTYLVIVDLTLTFHKLGTTVLREWNWEAGGGEGTGFRLGPGQEASSAAS